MQTSTRSILFALALTLVPTLAPVAALAAPNGNASAQQQQPVYTLTINNNTGSRQELQVGGKTYTVPARRLNGDRINTLFHRFSSVFRYGR